MAEIFICNEAHGRDTRFAKPEQCYYLTNTDAEAFAVRSVDALDTSQDEADARIMPHCMHM